MSLFAIEPMGKSAVVLRGFAQANEANLLRAIEEIQAAAPLRQMVTPGGRQMSVAMTNCGALGWVSEPRGYRYSANDPISAQLWPKMPPSFVELAAAAAQTAGFGGFKPDACLINRYVPGSRLSLHQDKDERDFTQPIVSVSLGMSAEFLFGGTTRTAPCAKLRLEHADVVVWGREDRLRFHGVQAIKGRAHSVLGFQRINLTFRKAG